MIKGITKQEYKILTEILKDYPYEFFVHGSRVRGDFSPLSDLDIMIKAKKAIPQSIKEELSYKFDNSLLPYVVNLSDFNTMDERFYDLIKDNLTKLNI